MTRNFLIILVLAFAFSCSSDDTITTLTANEPVDPGFYGLQVGNSWVYKNYKRNAETDTYEDTGVIDSVSVVGTQEFNGNTYFKFRRNTTGNENAITFCNPNGEHFEFVRDSLGFLIHEDGRIKFTNSDYNERVVNTETWGTIYETLNPSEALITVESGLFNCTYSERYAKSTDGDQFPGLDRYYYANGIGLISDTSSFVSSENHSIERRLNSHNIH